MDAITNTPEVTEHYNILLIEDNPGDALLLQEIFRDRGLFQIVHVDRLSAGIDYLARHQQVDLILLDVHLPDGSGMENIVKVRSVCASTPIIILTGLDDEMMAIEMVKEGVQDYLVKGSFNEKRLVRSIRYAIERHRAVSELEKSRLEVEHDAYHDHLTGLPNRKLFMDRLDNAIQQGLRYKRVLGVIFVDLDGFKEINDTLGHDVGDLMLKHVTQQLTSTVRASDTVARFGGDEFIIIVNQLCEEKFLNRIIEQLQAKLARPVELDGHTCSVSASIGISIYPFDGAESEELIKNADTAMYHAKNSGKNTFRRYNISMDEQAYDTLQIEKNLLRAIQEDELTLHYQPLIDIATGEMTSVEALVRWEDSESSTMIYPDQFIDIAERSNLMVPLGEWIMDRACADIKALQDFGHSPFSVAVNLSPRQFNDKGLHRKIINSLDSHHLDAELLSVEITESNAMNDVDYAIKMLGLLKDIGVKVAVDDFGTGYSSLSYLKQLPANALKIDRSFITGLPSNGDDKSITSAIIAMAHRLKLEVVAEGVETSGQLEFLKSLGCNKAQGYYFAKPLNFNALSEFLVERSHVVV
ncbi:MAG: EAL domain-containing protein [Calditrichia bacterium]